MEKRKQTEEEKTALESQLKNLYNINPRRKYSSEEFNSLSNKVHCVED